MPQEEAKVNRRRVSLSIRISLILLAVAIVPLLITIVIVELQTRPKLIDQSRLAMETDAKNRVQIINNYLTERLLEEQAFAQIPIVQDYMLAPTQEKGSVIIQTMNILANRNQNIPYTHKAFFDATGKLLLSYPDDNNMLYHGQYIIPPAEQQKLRLAKMAFCSAVYYNPFTKKGSVDLYAPSFSFELGKVIGFARVTLNLDYIWSVVDSEDGANGTGSYAFILDQNGVRIADPTPQMRFTAIAVLPPDQQKAISGEKRYGQSTPVAVNIDNGLYNALHNDDSPTTFEIQPHGKNETYQVSKQSLSVVPWTYLVLSPVSTIVSVANQQLFTAILVTFLITLPVVWLGIVMGRYITLPILSSVEALRTNSSALNALASQQEKIANEQKWIIEASQTGIESVRYYNNAAKVATKELDNMLQSADKNTQKTGPQQLTTRVTGVLQYIERAIHFQDTSNQNMSTAIHVTTQVTDQLISGAQSASEASKNLEVVVKQLQHIVGQ